MPRASIQTCNNNKCHIVGFKEDLVIFKGILASLCNDISPNTSAKCNSTIL
jgi:hypothetical protein